MYSIAIKHVKFNLGKGRSRIIKRTFTHKSSFTHLNDNKFSFEKINLDFSSNNIKTFQVNVTEPSYNPCISDQFKEFFSYFPDLYTIKGLFKTGNVETIKPLISDFYLDTMILKLTSFNVNGVVSCSSFRLQDFTFSPNFFTVEGSFFHAIILLLNNRFVQLVFLCTIVYLMQEISTVLCTDKKSFFFKILCKVNFLEEYSVNKTSRSVINFSWFINAYSIIISFSNRIEKYLYNISCHRFFHTILVKVYNNIRNLIVKFHFNLEFSKINLMLIKFNFTFSLHTLFRVNIVFFAGPNLNIIYAGLTPVYILLGWLLDYISYIWTVSSSEINFSKIFTLSFWLKRFLFSILYITWLSLGVFTTNGIYFLVLSMISSIDTFNIAIFVVGSIVSSITSSFWFMYGNPTIIVTFNLYRFIVNEIIFPVVLTSSNIHDVLNILSQGFSSLVSSDYFNHYTSLRRSGLEWMSFLSMVFSTYGSWNIYTVHVFNTIPIIYNFLIWTASSFILGFLLIYLEDSRPRFSNYYYGFTYILFWTSICFSTNSILLGYININNAAHVLVYVIPLNFILGFIYPLPLYRYNINTTITARLLDVLLFIILTSVTLLSAGSIWNLIAPL